MAAALQSVPVILPIDSHLPDRRRLAPSPRHRRGRRNRRRRPRRLPPAILAAGLSAPPHPHLVMDRAASPLGRPRCASPRKTDWHVGREVGYHVRFDRRVARYTPLRVLTEGILTRQLSTTPKPHRHRRGCPGRTAERTIHTALAIAILPIRKACVSMFLIVMSATLDAPVFRNSSATARSSRCPAGCFRSPYTTSSPPRQRIEDRIADAVASLLDSPDDDHGDVLIFLPAPAKSADRSTPSHRSAPRNFALLPLHSSLPPHQQLLALDQTPGRRKIIFATNIAETSLTIPGVTAVIDSGLARVPDYDRAGIGSPESVADQYLRDPAPPAGPAGPRRAMPPAMVRQGTSIPRRIPRAGNSPLRSGRDRFIPSRLGPSRSAYVSLLSIAPARVDRSRRTPVADAWRRRCDGKAHAARLAHGRCSRSSAPARACSWRRPMPVISTTARPSPRCCSSPIFCSIPPSTSPAAPRPNAEHGFQFRCPAAPRRACPSAERQHFPPTLLSDGVDPNIARQVAQSRDNLLSVIHQHRGSPTPTGASDDPQFRTSPRAYPDRVCRRPRIRSVHGHHGRRQRCAARSIQHRPRRRVLPGHRRPIRQAHGRPTRRSARRPRKR